MKLFKIWIPYCISYNYAHLIQNKKILFYKRNKFDVINIKDDEIQFLYKKDEVRYLKLISKDLDIWDFFDSYGNIISKQFNFKDNFCYLYIVYNNNVLIINQRCASTSLMTSYGYIKNIITKNQLNDKNYVYWNDHDISEKMTDKCKKYDIKYLRQLLNSKDINIHMVINPSIQDDIMKRFNVIKRKVNNYKFHNEKEKNDIIFNILKYNNTNNNYIDNCDPHLITRYSYFKFFDIDIKKVNFWSLDNINGFSNFFFGFDNVEHHVDHKINKTKWNDLSINQQNELLSIFKNDQILIDKIKN